MALQRVQFLAGGDIPQVHLIYPRPGHELAVRRERHGKRITVRHPENGSGFLHLSRERRLFFGVVATRGGGGQAEAQTEHERQTRNLAHIRFSFVANEVSWKTIPDHSPTATLV